MLPLKTLTHCSSNTGLTWSAISLTAVSLPGPSTWYNNGSRRPHPARALNTQLTEAAAEATERITQARLAAQSCWLSLRNIPLFCDVQVVPPGGSPEQGQANKGHGGQLPTRMSDTIPRILTFLSPKDVLKCGSVNHYFHDHSTATGRTLRLPPLRERSSVKVLTDFWSSNLRSNVLCFLLLKLAFFIT